MTINIHAPIDLRYSIVVVYILVGRIIWNQNILIFFLYKIMNNYNTCMFVSNGRANEIFRISNIVIETLFVFHSQIVPTCASMVFFVGSVFSKYMCTRVCV